MRPKYICLKAMPVLLVLWMWLCNAAAQNVPYPAPEQVAVDLKSLLARPEVPLNPRFIITKTDSVLIARGTINSEASEKVPVLIYKPITGLKQYPVVIFLHGTGGSKDNAEIKDMLYRLTRLGIIGVAIDARFHGERVAGGAHGSIEYTEAAYKAWKNIDKTKQEHPFLYDTAYDLWRLTDYLTTRNDVDPNRIGMSGISMGGMETWLAAAVDKRIKVVVLNIAVQSFNWSLNNNQWQGRVGTIKAAHQQAAHDMGDNKINAKNVKQFWDKVIPGITGEFDCPSMIRLIAPRPLLILSNEKDQNCPLPGAMIAYNVAKVNYAGQQAADKLKIDITPDLPHRSTPAHLQMTLDWFAKWL